MAPAHLPALASIFSTLGAAHLISVYGLAGVIVIIFAETGLLIGFFLPGDSLLVLAGAYAATHHPHEPHLALLPLLVGAALAAIVGGQVGYLIGRRAGPALFERRDSRLFRREYVVRTRAVLERYGEIKAVLLARVIPIVRTFINPVVGVVGMPAHRFAIANVAGGVIWSVGVTMAGYALGAALHIDTYILPITAVVIVASLTPIVLETLRHRRRSRAVPADGAVPADES
ncbi:MAG: DedA family protein [Mycobacteriales bacterium]